MVNQEIIKKEKKVKEKKPFWELGLNPITMWEPVKDNYLDTQNKTKKYVRNSEE